MSCGVAIGSTRVCEEGVCFKGVTANGRRAGALVAFGSTGATKLAKAIGLLCCCDTVKSFIATWFGLASLLLMGGAANGTMASFFLSVRAGWGTNGISAGSEGGVDPDKAFLLAGGRETGACGVGTGDKDGGAGNFRLVILIPASSRSKGTFGASISDACIADDRSEFAALGLTAIFSIQ